MPNTIRIPVAGFIKYSLASTDSQKRNVLRRLKNDDPLNRYSQSGAILRQYHRENRDDAWLRTRAQSLYLRSPSPTPGQLRILDSNVEVLNGYAVHFSRRRIVQQRHAPKLTYSHSSVTIPVHADLYGIERGRMRLIRYQFAQPQQPQIDAQITCHLLYEALTNAGLQLRRSAIRVWDCRTGDDFRFGRHGVQLQRRIEDACQNISLIWPSIN